MACRHAPDKIAAILAGLEHGQIALLAAHGPPHVADDIEAIGAQAKNKVRKTRIKDAAFQAQLLGHKLAEIRIKPRRHLVIEKCIRGICEVCAHHKHAFFYRGLRLRRLKGDDRGHR
jgi:hypothetical protein